MSVDIRKVVKDRVGQVTKILKDLGYTIDSEWYQNITTWMIWYTGFDPEFHVYRDEATAEDGATVNEIQISSLHMGKTVCEDWAALLLGEKTEITVEDETSNEYIQGKEDDQMQGGLFGDTNFWQRANELVEKSFALGFGAIVPRIKEAKISDKGVLLSGKESIDFFTADQIFPLTYENRTITSCAFVGERAVKDGTIITVQIHDPGHILYRYYKATKDGLEMVDMGDQYAQEITFADKTLFLPSFIYPQVNNHLDITTPFGVSVFSTAIDVLKGTDLAYDNFNTDIELGRKMVFVSNELMETDMNGRKVAPQKTRKRLFEKVGGDLPGTGDRDPFIHEYNPALRVAENASAVQAQLDYLSFKCGLGAKYYRFQDGTVQTATQIVSDNGVLFRNRRKHNTVIQKSLIDFTRKALQLAVELKVPGIKPETAINVVDDDSIITDTNTEKLIYQQEITAGIRQTWEYRVEFFGEDEAEAKRMAAPPKPIISEFNLDDGKGTAASVAAAAARKGQEPGQSGVGEQGASGAAREGAES